MRVPRIHVYVPVSCEELDRALGLISLQQRASISREGLKICANEIGRALFRGSSFSDVAVPILRRQLPDTDMKRLSLYEEAAHAIFENRHLWELNHAREHGHAIPKPFPKRKLKSNGGIVYLHSLFAR